MLASEDILNSTFLWIFQFQSRNLGVKKKNKSKVFLSFSFHSPVFLHELVFFFRCCCWIYSKSATTSIIFFHCFLWKVWNVICFHSICFSLLLLPKIKSKKKNVAERRIRNARLVCYTIRDTCYYWHRISNRFRASYHIINSSIKWHTISILSQLLKLWSYFWCSCNRIKYNLNPFHVLYFLNIFSQRFVFCFSYFSMFILYASFQNPPRCMHFNKTMKWNKYFDEAWRLSLLLSM